MGGGARHEALVGRVKLRAGDGTLHRLHAQLLARQADDGVARDADEDVVRVRRRDQLAVLDDEDVLAAALGDVAVAGEHDRLVEAVLLRLRLGERGVDVDAGHFRPRRNRQLVDAAPGGGHAADALVEVQVRAEGRDVHQEVVVQVVHAHADDLGALVGDGPQVDVLGVAAHADQLRRDVAELVGRCKGGRS